MAPFARRGIGEIWLGGMNKTLFRALMRMQGIGDGASVSKTELAAYLDLMRGDDRGRAFLKVMRSTERTPEKEALYRSTVRNVPYPVQVVWAAEDPALKLQVYGERAESGDWTQGDQHHPRKALPAGGPGPAIADYVAAIAATTSALQQEPSSRPLIASR